MRAIINIIKRTQILSGSYRKWENRGFVATLLFVLMIMAGCSNEEYLGEFTPTNTNGQISFGTVTPRITRAEGTEAADLLGKNFVLWGTKTVNDAEQHVFENYQINYTVETDHSTPSNQVGWEYVGYKNLPEGVKTNEGVVAFANDAQNAKAIEQSIKYWDYSASQYDFFAYSLGLGVDDDHNASTPNVYATAGPMSSLGYTLSGTQDELAACYISKKKSISSLSATETKVDLEFINFLSKIQLKFYETIPGYSVKNLKFYVDTNTKSTGSDDNDGLAPAIFGASESISTGGTYTVTFDALNNPVVTVTETTTTKSSIEFPAPVTDPSTEWLEGYVIKEYKETPKVAVEPAVYLGRSSNTATATSQINVLPNATGTTLTLKMDYTLQSRDGTGETIEVRGATATIPAVYTQWKPNYVYTYIFKISDNTNGQILYPITLDAVAVDDIQGVQTTITTVTTPSITTYQHGAITDKYQGGNIYVVVNKETVNVPLTLGTNANFYTVTLAPSTDTGDVPEASAAQSISEASVADALASGTKDVEDNPTTWTVKDDNKWKLTVTKSNLLTTTNSIPAEDTPDGIEIEVVGAVFNATAGTTYVFEYIEGAVLYTEEEAAEYNAALGALSTAPLTADQAALYNATLTGAKSEGYELSDAAAANAYNATLTGAKAEGYQLTEAEANTYNAKLEGAIASNTRLNADQVRAVNTICNLSDDGAYKEGEIISSQHAAQYNATLTGALNSTDALDATKATAYNAKLTGAKAAGDTLSAEEAAAYNATLAGAKAADETLSAEEAAAYNTALGCVSAGANKTEATKYYKVIKVENE